MKKPQIKLNPLERTVINTKTKEQADELMKIFECGNWKWADENLPTTSMIFWYAYGGETCVEAGIHSFSHQRDKFSYCNENDYLKNKFKIISPQEFYQIERITTEQIKEINDYFDMQF